MMMQVTPLALESHQRSQRFHADIARRASLIPQREERAYSIPNTPFGIPKINMLPKKPPPRNHEPDWWHSMWFFDLVFVRVTARTGTLLVEDIIRAVAQEFGIRRVDMLSRRKDPKVAIPRMAGYYIAKKLTPRTLPDIGRRFGGRDHTSILAGIRRIEALRQRDQAVDTHIHNIIASLGGSA